MSEEAVIRSYIQKIELNRLERRKRRLLFTQARWKEEAYDPRTRRGFDEKLNREAFGFAEKPKYFSRMEARKPWRMHTKANRNFLLRWGGKERKIGESFVPWIILFKQALMSTFVSPFVHANGVYTSRISLASARQCKNIEIKTRPKNWANYSARHSIGWV